MYRWFLILLVPLLLCGAVFADNFHDGYVTPAGFTYRGGYWHRDGLSYTRAWVVTRAAYWSGGQPGCGVRYPEEGYYQYSLYTPPYQAPAPAKAVDYDQAEAALIKIAADRERHKQFLEKIKALGLDVNTLPPGIMPPAPYGYPQQYGYQGHYYNYQIPVNANTQYGYQYAYNQVAKQYAVTGDFPTPEQIIQLVQLQAQMASGAQKYGASAAEGTAALVERFVVGQIEIAKIRAKGDVAVALIKSMEGAPTAQYQGYSFKILPGGRVEKYEDNVDPKNKAALFAQWQQLVKQRCDKCHSGATPAGGFNVLTEYPTLQQKEKEYVLSLLSMRPNDPQYEKKMMPQAEGGKGPGTPLTPEEFRLFAIQ